MLPGLCNLDIVSAMCYLAAQPLEEQMKRSHNFRRTKCLLILRVLIKLGSLIVKHLCLAM